MTAARRAEQDAKKLILSLAGPLLLGSRDRRGGAAPWTAETPRTAPVRIAAIRQDDRLGNLVLATPFLRRLRESFPNATIEMIVSDRYHRILEGFPAVDRVMLVEKNASKRRPWRYLALLRRLGRRGYDLAFDLSDSSAFSLSSALMTLATRAGTRVGFENARAASYLTLAVPQPRGAMHAADVPLLLLHAVAGPVGAAPLSLPLPGESAVAEAFLAGARARGERIVGVNLGGRGAKRWPAAAYRRLLEALLAEPHTRPVLVWGPGERGLLALFADLGARGVLQAPLLPEDDLGRMLRGLDLFITPDTGAMHLAAAVDTPVVAIFLHSEREKYAPRGPRHRVLGGHGETVAVSQVLAAARDILGSGGPARRAGESC